ncbi:FtsK/SpoIIIE domain-containing protein [Kocuria tytonis]|uniref:FtsK domain-containing protein n=1 Tax=Kocuria tytonis TaxID=2054280 RepID=A0A495AD62_9MICC|nr:FtsK/SpoIIIE domain-containing protein [Kocuria tytonis]RKQ36705.1 hypothetical protein C1C97_003480 [Kocuria tytonis]
MHLSLHVAWLGSETSHPADLTAPSGTPGSVLAAELARRVGGGHIAFVAGRPLADTLVGEPPVTDGATVMLHPTRTDAAPGARQSAENEAAVSAADGRDPAPCGTGPGGGPDDAASLVSVAGTGVGTRLPLPRGNHVLELRAEEPALSPGHTGCGSGVPLLVDHSGVHVHPGGASLGHGDVLRVGRADRVAWLRCEHSGGIGPRSTWPDPAGIPSGFTAREADPAHPLSVDTAAHRRARLAMITGLLPLVAGIGIAVVTHWWFFLVFSALGALTSAAGWAGDRGARAEQRRRLAAALERDLRRCEHAAPSAAETIERCRALAVAHHGAASQPGAAPLQPAGAGAVRHPAESPSGRGDTERPAWVRLGHGTRVAQLAVGRGVSVGAVTHERAPVLLDLTQLPELTLALDPVLASGVLNCLAVQLFTGPGALSRLSVSPGLDWRAPLAAGPPTVPGDACSVFPESCGALTALEVLTPEDAAHRPRRAGVARIVVVRGAAPEDADAVVTEVSGLLRLSCHSSRAVPGLSAQEQRTSVKLLPDTVTRGTAAGAIAAWRRWAGARGAHGAGGSGELPRTVGSGDLLSTVGGAAERTGPDAAPGAPVPRPSRPGGRSLGTLIGVSRAGVERIVLDDENPHLLIAGTTGCGKSEVLRTLVAGLAREFSPARLEFVFVDFKGGAALAPLTGLPHVHTLLTDLGPDEVERALVFLRSELQRRERVLTSHGCQDMRQLLHAAGARTPIRELVVVVDEAKMLTDSFPRAAEQLAVIATVGRSLGVHLVLATQRPQGALPADVRANISQALCLRVRTEQDSVDVIGSPVAARIPVTVPGRGFLDRGAGPPVEVQCAVLTRMTAPEPEDLVLRFLPPVAPAAVLGSGDHPGSSPIPSLRGGVSHAVRDVVRIWTSPGAERPGPAAPGASGTVSDRAVPPGLSRRGAPEPVSGRAVDLGEAESPAAHWSGRAVWWPWQDGPLVLVGRPSMVRDSFASVVNRCARWGGADEPAGPALPGVAVYVLSASGRAVADLVTADGTAAHGAVRGWARAECPADVSRMIGLLRSHLEQHPADPRGTGELAVLAVDDWDRCTQVLRGGTWAHLEDDLLALLGSGADRGLSAVVAGDRHLVSGRGSHLGPNRLYFPGEQSADALLHWPRLPPFTPEAQRAALTGPAARRCAPPDVHRHADPSAVVQLAEGWLPAAGACRPDPTRQPPDHPPRGRAVPPADPRATALASASWPRSFPLPAVWSAPEEDLGGLPVGVTAEGEPAVHPWGPGSTLLVTGPARSGRTSFLEWAQDCLGRPSVEPGRHPSGGGGRDHDARRTEARTGTRSGLEPPVITMPGVDARRTESDGVRGVAPHRVLRVHPRTVEEVRALLRPLSNAEHPTTVVIDDADRLPPDVLRALAATWDPRPPVPDPPHGPRGASVPQWRLPGGRVILSAQLTDSLPVSFPPLSAWRQQSDTLLLRPRRSFDGDMFGVSLTGQGMGGPPGRGFWLRRGNAQPVQTPAPRGGCPTPATGRGA